VAEASARADAVVAEAFGPGKYVARMNYTNLYFLPGVFDRVTAQRGLLETLMQAIGQVPGVFRVIDSRTLDPHAVASDPYVQATALSEFPGRSGDLIVVPKMNWIWVPTAPGDPTTHGTSYPYDQRVPLLLMGTGVRPGRYEQSATPADIAPTLAKIAGVALPGATGRALDEAILK